MKERLSQQAVALRAAKEFKDGDYVNLGAGIPLLCATYAPIDKDVFFQAEQGMLGYSRIIQIEEWGEADLDYVDALGQCVLPSSPGLSFFDMDTSFDMIRGGHLDYTVLGGLEVSEKGDLANWTRGNVGQGTIGGGMDLAVGAKKVIVAMTHTTRDGKPKVVNECRLPLTGKECVDLIVTDLAVLEVTERGLLLKEVAPGWTFEEVQSLTEVALIPDPALQEIQL
ncbi:MAG: succinyl-CoA--3-ketoacid-CoA transferase [Thaumarchaeota archaeon]|nr:succinyl-CoA--3-ketoacid-CoA transferase [Nitrososphaerota archaeon]